MIRDILNQVRFGFFAGLLRLELIRNGSKVTWLMVFESLLDLILMWQDIDSPSLRHAFAKDLQKFTGIQTKNYEIANTWAQVLGEVGEPGGDVGVTSKSKGFE